MGEIAYAQEDYDSAANFFERNININSDSLSATALGNMYMQAENIQQAADYFSFALRQDESNGEAALGLASAYISLDENPDLDLVEQLLQVAMRSENQGTRDSARQCLQQIRELRTERANQNNCFITTAVCGSFGKADDCFEFTTLRKFRDTWLTAQPDGKSLIAEYYDIAPRIVANINRLANAKEIYKNIWQNYLEPCLKFIERGENLACRNKYVEMVRDLKQRYL